MLCVFMVSCAKPDKSIKNITLVIGQGDSQKIFSNYKTESEFLIDVLNELKDDNKITFTAVNSSYGAYLTEINGITPSGDNSYIAILTTIGKYQDSTEYKVEKVYNDIVFVSSIVGVSDLKIIDGESYMIALA